LFYPSPSLFFILILIIITSSAFLIFPLFFFLFFLISYLSLSFSNLSSLHRPAYLIISSITMKFIVGTQLAAVLAVFAAGVQWCVQ